MNNRGGIRPCMDVFLPCKEEGKGEVGREYRFPCIVSSHCKGFEGLRDAKNDAWATVFRLL